MAKEQYELIMLDFWEEYGLPEGYAVEVSGDHDNAGDNFDQWET